MNLILQNVTAYRGVTVASAVVAKLRFPVGTLTGDEILGAGANITPLHSFRISISAGRRNSGIISSWIELEETVARSVSGTAADSDETILEANELARFESEGGNGKPGGKPVEIPQSEVWRRIARELHSLAIRE